MREVQRQRRCSTFHVLAGPPLLLQSGATPQETTAMMSGASQTIATRVIPALTHTMTSCGTCMRLSASACVDKPAPNAQEADLRMEWIG